MESEQKFLKDYLVEYKHGNKDVFEELIYYTQREVFDNNTQEYYKVPDLLQFKDIALNKHLYELEKKYKNRLDQYELRSFFLQAVLTAFDEIKEYEDKSPAEVLSYCIKKIKTGVSSEASKKNGFVRDSMGWTKEKSLVKCIDSEDTGQFEEVYNGEELTVSLWDDYVVNEDRKKEYTNEIQAFFGLIDKRLLLKNERHYQILICLREGLTYDEIAKKIGLKGSPSNQIKTVKNELVKEFKRYIETKNQLHGFPLDMKIIQFLNTYRYIKTYSNSTVEEEFAFVYDFIKEHYSKEENEINWQQLMKNVVDDSYSIYKILSDHCHGGTMNTINKMLQDESFTPDKAYVLVDGKKKYQRPETRSNIVHHVIKAFEAYTGQVEIPNNDMIEYIFRRKEKEQDVV
ncbi:hypothetical protein [Ammoniphilus resinae]|uniref:RNA polymerase sigma factor 70 region 4 type 2 domain-containing protein n=1 Tax=Ammoniphilus resinae TaxID=861532 RepID=A0ABS4GXM6_9BACL|nr:hypothetical protein [Ammoniphilus resinae]MBP1935028.1 hypothetical protein [Ammoniphilus resinae]